ncbi:unnamed protein product [Mesocestoides corti]|uniref:PHD-type domain-containing protein n=1 Tax=Mesocestoides corti TaxID=53468 RepID=A0A3P6G5V1_MESCO|nr:unnamed protein product [Mesocestoides corti]
MSAANQQIVNQRSTAQVAGDNSESDPYHLPSANTPEDPHPRSVYSSSSEPQQTESSMSSVNSSSYMSPIKLKSPNDLDYSSSRNKPFSGYAPPTSSNHQPPPPTYDQHPYYGAPSALASMDHMASSLLRQHQQPQHSLLAQLQSASYKSYVDSSSHYYSYPRAYVGGRPSFFELKGMLRHRRAQYPATSIDAFTCGYCQMHVEGGGGGGPDTGAEGEGELIICCCECDRGYHGYCLAGSSPGYQAASFPDDWVCEICRQQDACLPPQPPLQSSTLH